MRALTIRSPWINLILAGEKRYEYRRWTTKWRGPLLLHTAARRDLDAPDHLLARFEGAPLGCLLGVCTLVDVERLTAEQARALCVHDDCPEAGDWAWRLRDVVPLAEPVPWRGQQWVFEVPDYILHGRLWASL